MAAFDPHLPRLAALVDQAGARLSFDRERDITKPCWYCRTPAAPAHRLRVIDLRVCERIRRPVCSTCHAAGFGKARRRRFRLAVIEADTRLVILEVMAGSASSQSFFRCSVVIPLGRHHAAAVASVVATWRTARRQAPYCDAAFSAREGLARG